MSMFGIWMGLSSRNENGDPLCPSSKKYSRVTNAQMPPTRSFSYCLTVAVGTTTPLIPRLKS